MDVFAPSKPAQWVLGRAEQLGLRPKVDPVPYRGSWRVILSGTGEWSGFGGLLIGARTGRILRANLTFGNDGPTRRYRGHHGAHALLRDYTAYQIDLWPVDQARKSTVSRRSHLIRADPVRPS